jgi:hypothetical protein
VVASKLTDCSVTVLNERRRWRSRHLDLPGGGVGGFVVIVTVSVIV